MPKKKEQSKPISLDPSHIYPIEIETLSWLIKIIQTAPLFKEQRPGQAGRKKVSPRQRQNET